VHQKNQAVRIENTLVATSVTSSLGVLGTVVGLSIARESDPGERETVENIQ
jgi:hypothetical protein